MEDEFEYLYDDGYAAGIAAVSSALDRVKQPFIERMLSGDTSDVVKGSMVALNSMQDEIDKLTESKNEE